MVEFLNSLSLFGIPLVTFYWYGIVTGWIFFGVAAFGFAIYRWCACFTDYVNGMDLDYFSNSFSWDNGDHFNTKNNQPVAVFFDLAIHCFYSALVSLVWFITMPVLSIIFVAKSMRRHRMEQKEIMNRLRN